MPAIRFAPHGLLLLPLLCASLAAGAEDAKFEKKTYVYKTVGDTKIEADVHRASDDKVRPVVMWIHGGAMIVGSRTSIPQNLLELCRKEGYALVSIDYRLAPGVKLVDIIEDVKDSVRWIRGRAAALHLDPKKLVVTGGSAGGCLTMATGVVVDPRPTALVAYWGYGDVDGTWLTQPSEFYRKTIPLIDKDDAYQGVAGKVSTGTTTPEDGKARGRFYHYLRQNGLWTKVVTGLDPATDQKKLDELCTVRNLTSQYPPILMIHGTVDDDVPYDKSADMDKELTRLKVPHELITIPGAGHGLSGGDKQLVADAHARALAFIREHLK